MIPSMAAIRATGRRICLSRQPTRVSAANRTPGRENNLGAVVMKHGLLVLTSLSALTLLTLGGGLIFAHHSVSATYIHGKSVKIEGTLKEFLWRNPHSF